MVRTLKRSLHVAVFGSPGSLLAELNSPRRVHEDVNSPKPNGPASVRSHFRLRVAPTGPVTVPEMVTSNSSVTALGNSIRLTNVQLAASINTEPGCIVGVGVAVGVAVGVGVGVGVSVGVGEGVISTEGEGSGSGGAGAVPATFALAITAALSRKDCFVSPSTS